jgi:hypothetical protein
MHNAFRLSFVLLAVAFLLGTLRPMQSEARSRTGQCIKERCKQQKKSCMRTSTQQFKLAKHACAAEKTKNERKQCKTETKRALRESKGACKRAYKQTCKECCAGDQIVGCTITVCGDGIRVAGEECEPGDDPACPDECQDNCTCPTPTTVTTQPLSTTTTTTPKSTTTTTAPESASTTTTRTTTTPLCGNGVLDGSEQCDPPDYGGVTCKSLGFNLGGTLHCPAACQYDVSDCECQAIPATGQTTCWDGSGQVVPCAGTGYDGDIRAGSPLAYRDNGDGTITDLNTGLMWEKKDDNNVGGIHDKDTTYTWEQAFTVHVAGLNGTSFAGHSDWRLPNYKELVSILSFEKENPAVNPVFDTECVGGCDVSTCSCTAWSVTDPLSYYWSSTTRPGVRSEAWAVNFAPGDPTRRTKTLLHHVRAVRGGL